MCNSDELNKKRPRNNITASSSSTLPTNSSNKISQFPEMSNSVAIVASTLKSNSSADNSLQSTAGLTLSTPQRTYYNKINVWTTSIPIFY